MEYMKGGSLTDIITSDAHLTETMMATVSCEVLCGLQHLHKLGIIHRDIKSDNVLVDLDGSIKLSALRTLAVAGAAAYSACNRRTLFRPLDHCRPPPAADFGYCAHLGDKGTRKTMCGTHYWMAPEIVKRSEYSFQVRAARGA